MQSLGINPDNGSITALAVDNSISIDVTRPNDLSALEFPMLEAERPRILPDCLADRAGAERIRALSHWLHQLRQKKTLRTLLVTSAAPKEGKTFVAVNLASALARTSAPVLLIDADLRGPRIGQAMGFPALPGMAACLEQLRTLDSVIRRLNQPGLFYCPAGENPVDAAELLQTPTLPALLQEVAAKFEWIVLDSPPVLPFVDSRCIANLVDGVLLVARQHRTSKEELRQAQSQLGDSRLLGLILNDSDDRGENRYYTHYHYRCANTSSDSE